MNDTTLPKLNVKLLDQIEEIITKHPKRHEQMAWRVKLAGKNANLNGAPARECGTAMCVAGWAVELDRGKWAFSAASAHSDLLVARKAEIEAGLAVDWAQSLHDRPLIETKVRARRILGLTTAEAEELFSAYNTQHRIKKLIARAKARRGLKA